MEKTKVRRFGINLCEENPIPVPTTDQSEVAAVIDKKINRYRRRYKRLQSKEEELIEENKQLVDYYRHLKEDDEVYKEKEEEWANIQAFKDREILLLQTELQNSETDSTELSSLYTMNLKNLQDKIEAKQETIQTLKEKLKRKNSKNREIEKEVAKAQAELDKIKLKTNKRGF